MAIRSFRCKHTETLWERQLAAPHLRAFAKVALRKLAMLNRAGLLDDLRVPPGNHLEALRDDRRGQHSIRINGQWRVCFVWTNTGPANVEIVDYH